MFYNDALLHMIPYNVSHHEIQKRTQDYTSDIESAIRAIRTCERIITSSLRGLIVGDCGWGSKVWAESGSTKGLEFKF